MCVNFWLTYCLKIGTPFIMRSMFTIEQINDIHDRFGNSRTLSRYLRALSAIGVQKYDSYLEDGHSEYFGSGGHTVISPPTHSMYAVASTSNHEHFLRHLEQHKNGNTNYFQMSEDLAESGIEKWTFDTGKLTLTYYNKSGNIMLTEKVT